MATDNTKIRTNHSLIGFLFYVILVLCVIFTVYFSFYCANYLYGQLPFISNNNKLYLSNGSFHLSSFIPNKLSFVMYSFWFFFQILLALFCPGKKAKGVLLENKRRLNYQLNGLSAFKVTILVTLYVYFFEIFSFRILLDQRSALISVSLIYSLFILSLLCIKSKTRIFSRNFAKEFWLGFELNPRLGNFDLKFFLEGRPGLMLWVLFDFAFCVVLFEETDNYWEMLNIVALSLMHFLYVMDYFLHEKAILTTMDITTEKLGFMLVFGDLSWVPFVYSVSTAVLYARRKGDLMWSEGSITPTVVGSLMFSLGVILFAVGFYVFRKANSEKNEFRSDPQNEKFRGKFLETKNSKRLLVSGLWGMARHMNYTGDLLVAWGMSLVTCSSAFWAYFYPIFFTVMICHRELRDEAKCKLKYGEDWEKYCDLVPYRLIPKIY